MYISADRIDYGFVMEAAKRMSQEGVDFLATSAEQCQHSPESEFRKQLAQVLMLGGAVGQAVLDSIEPLTDDEIRWVCETR
jgi:hypothetical protein